MNILNKKLSIPKDVIVICEDDKYLLIRSNVPNWIVVNKNSALLISKLDGDKTNMAVLDDLCLTGKAREDAIYFLEYELLSFIDSEKMPSRKQKILKSVHLNIGETCNLKCCYCYASCRPSSDTIMSNKDYIKLLNDIKTISDNNTVISFTGGEPLLYKDVLRIAAQAKYLGFTNYLLTNGTLIDSHNAKNLTKYFDIIKISVDGVDRETHDYHRGKGSYDKIISAISVLEDVNANLSIVMTVTKRNISHVGRMAAIYGQKLTFQPLFNAGSAKGKDLQITGEEYYEALYENEKISAIGNISRTLEMTRYNGTTKCAVGDVEISISAGGDVYPCHLLHEEQFKCGNVLINSICDIYFQSDILSNFRNLNVDEFLGCKDCTVKYICGGSCRARSYFTTGTLNGCDDFCCYEKLAYIKGIFDNYNIMLCET